MSVIQNDNISIAFASGHVTILLLQDARVGNVGTRFMCIVGKEEEMIAHLFFNCEYIQRVWNVFIYCTSLALYRGDGNCIPNTIGSQNW